MNIESGPGCTVAQKFERVGSVISPRERALRLCRSNDEAMPMVDAISGFE